MLAPSKGTRWSGMIAFSQSSFKHGRTATEMLSNKVLRGVLFHCWLSMSCAPSLNLLVLQTFFSLFSRVPSLTETTRFTTFSWQWVSSGQFSPLTEVVGGTRGTIQQRFSSGCFCGRPLWGVLAWSGTLTPWCCPSSISSPDYGMAHLPGVSWRMGLERLLKSVFFFYSARLRACLDGSLPLAKADQVVLLCAFVLLPICQIGSPAPLPPLSPNRHTLISLESTVGYDSIESHSSVFCSLLNSFHDRDTRVCPRVYI